MNDHPAWANDAVERRRAQLDDMRRRGFGLPAARDLADRMERIEATRRARQGAVPTGGERVSAEDIGACGFIVCLILLGLPVCAILFAIGGG